MFDTFQTEALATFVSALRPVGWVLAVTALIILVVRKVERAGDLIPESLGRRIYVGLVAAGICVGLYLAYQRLWLCDDAFISFRYARNWADGHGLVFNPGERVEGYTNFLWTALLAIFSAAGLDIPLFALLGNLVAFVAVAVLVARCVRKFSPLENSVVPWAALGLCGSLGFTSFASSGLETMPATALVVGGILATSRSISFGGTLFVLAAMTRPDHLLFWGAMGLALVAEDLVANDGRLLLRLNWGRYLKFSIPLFVIFIPYFIARFAYYGEVFPNTYYAKSGGEAYYEQGVIYLFGWLSESGAWLSLPLLLLLLPGRFRSRDEVRLRFFSIVSLIVFMHYVVRVGGDFMANRFLVVLWPLMLMTLEVRARWALKGWHGSFASSALALGVAATVTPLTIFAGKEKKWNIAAEYSFYRVTKLFPLEIDSGYFRMGQSLGDVFRQTDYRPKLAIGCVGMVGYYSELPLVDRFGLTNRAIARKKIEKRGRPGHEKKGNLEEVMKEGAELALSPLHGRDRAYLTEFRVNGVKLHLVNASSQVLEMFSELSQVSIPQVVRSKDQGSSALDRTDQLEELAFYSLVAPRSLRAIELRSRLGSLADFEATLPDYEVLRGAAPVLASGNPPFGASGRGWLEIMPYSTVRMSFDFSGYKEVRASVGGVGAVELWRGPHLLHRENIDTPRRLQPLSWQVADLGATELRVEAGDRPLLVDAVRVPSTPDIRERLSERCGATDLAESLLQAELELGRKDSQVKGVDEKCVRQRFDFEFTRWPDQYLVRGAAFGIGPSAGKRGRQRPVRGYGGSRLLNSYRGGDSAKGQLEMGPIQVPKRIGFRVGGGANCKAVYIALRVAGEIVKRACGKNSESLRTVVWDTAQWEGMKGEIVVVDASRSRWGHILLDDVLLLEN